MDNGFVSRPYMLPGTKEDSRVGVEIYGWGLADKAQGLNCAVSEERVFEAGRGKQGWG